MKQPAGWVQGSGVAIGLLLLPSIGVAGQVPDPAPPPRPAPDSLVAVDREALGDSIRMDPGEPAAPSREGPAVPDSAAPPPDLPRILPWTPQLEGAGIVEWSDEALLWRRALTLRDLVEEVPGLNPIRGGDSGAPGSASYAGLSGGRVRVFRDGIELLPLEGGTVDLATIGLGGIERVRFERGLGELRIDLVTRQATDARPWSRIEVATGDLETNLFRGHFLHPRVAGGQLLLSLDRIDTRGREGRWPGTQTAVHAGWTRSILQDRGALSVAYATGGASRDTLHAPADLSTRELRFSGRVRPVEGATVEGWWGRRRSAGEGSPRSDTLDFARERTHYGLRAEWARSIVRGRVDFRGGPSGQGWPDRTLEGELGVEDPRWGGLRVRETRSSGVGGDASRRAVRVWTAPRFGVHFFGEWSDGSSGLPGTPVLLLPRNAPGLDPLLPDSLLDPSSPGPAGFDTRSGLQVGAGVLWKGIDLEGSWLRIEQDSLRPMGLPFEAPWRSVPGAVRSGVEGRLGLPLLLDGLRLEGWGQVWQPAESGEAAGWPWSPDLLWDARVVFHDTFLPTGNFELRVEIGARGRGAMRAFPPPSALPAAPLPELPAQRSWTGRLQFRVVQLRAFVQWENFTLAPEILEVPGRFLPQTRTTYGIRWNLWN